MKFTLYCGAIVVQRSCLTLSPAEVIIPIESVLKVRTAEYLRLVHSSLPMIDPSQTLPLSGEFSDEQLLAICEAADVITCECPAYLVRLLQETREFQRYTNECIEQFPENATTHHWLNSQIAQIQSQLSKTILELMNRENLLDTSNQLNLERLSERNRQIVLSKVAS